MSKLHQEHHFERESCAHLAAHGWLHAEGDFTRRCEHATPRKEGCLYDRHPRLRPHR